MQWTIDYYVTQDGKCPVREFIDSLSPASKAKYVFIANLLEEFGIGVKKPYVKAIKRKTKLFEVRIKDRENIHRILYFAFTGKKFVMLDGFTKKTEKTPAKELAIAEMRMDKYLSGRRRHDDL